MVEVSDGTLRSARNTPKENWNALVSDWTRISAIGFPEDCRSLLQMREECRELGMWEELGYNNEDEFFREALFLNPETVDLACQALEIADPETPIGINAAVGIGERNAEIHRLRALGMTQQAIADEIGGISREGVSKVLVRNSVITEKVPKRVVERYQISSYTKPETAATKIREKFGDEFADQLKENL